MLNHVFNKHVKCFGLKIFYLMKIIQSEMNWLGQSDICVYDVH